jgi:hypothetical protein
VTAAKTQIFRLVLNRLALWSKRGDWGETKLLFIRPEISAGLLQGLLHRLNGNFRRIIINGVYFFKVVKALFNPFYSLQPFQGMFAYVISLNGEDHL